MYNVIVRPQANRFQIFIIKSYKISSTQRHIRACVHTIFKTVMSQHRLRHTHNMVALFNSQSSSSAENFATHFFKTITVQPNSNITTQSKTHTKGSTQTFVTPTQWDQRKVICDARPMFDLQLHICKTQKAQWSKPLQTHKATWNTCCCNSYNLCTMMYLQKL